MKKLNAGLIYYVFQKIIFLYFIPISACKVGENINMKKKGLIIDKIRSSRIQVIGDSKNNTNNLAALKIDSTDEVDISESVLYNRFFR